MQSGHFTLLILLFWLLTPPLLLDYVHQPLLQMITVFLVGVMTALLVWVRYSSRSV